MPNLTIREILHKKGKTIVIILGLAFSLLMVIYSSSMWNGVLSRSSEVIDQYDFDVWIQQENSDTILENGIMNDSIYQNLKDHEGIKDIERLIQWSTEAETEDYTVRCIMIGYELESDNIEPWDVIEGDIDDLKQEDGIIVDKTIERYVGELSIGDKLTFGEVEMEIVGFVKNSQFMGSPYVWASLQTAQKLAPWAGEWCQAIGIELEDGYTHDDVKDWIDDLDKAGDLPHKVEVNPTEELRENTYDFIVNEGGMGGSIYIIVIMGYFVALIIISVVMYQNIQEKIPEFGTLKAIGASKGYINKVLIGEVFLYVSISFILATVLTYGLVEAMSSVSVVPAKLSLPATLLLYIITLGLSFACSLFSIRKVHKIDPAIVFRG